jgi:hypothetical protein
MVYLQVIAFAHLLQNALNVARLLAALNLIVEKIMTLGQARQGGFQAPCL